MEKQPAETQLTLLLWHNIANKSVDSASIHTLTRWQITEQGNQEIVESETEPVCT